MSRIAVALVVLALCAHVDRASAQLPLELAWDVPAECPDADAVRAELERIVVLAEGRSPALLVAEGRIVRATEGFRLTLSTEREGERGRRTLVASSCGDLLRAVTLVLALAYGEGVELRTDDEEEEPEARAPAVVPTSVEARGDAPIAEPPRVASPSLDAVRLFVLGELGTLVGLLPEASFAGALGVEVGSAYWRARLRLAASPGAARSLAEGASAQLVGMSAGLEGCAGAPVDAIRGEACAGVVLYGVHGRAQGLADAREALAPLVSLRGALSVGVATGAIEVRLVGGVEWASSQPRFEVIGLGTVHVVSELLLTGAIALAWAP